MLVISQNLVLSAAEEVLPEGTPLILYESIVTATNIAASSTETGYPASNLANPSTVQEWHALETSPGAAVELTITNSELTYTAAVGIARHNFGTAGIAVTVGFYRDASPDEFVILAGPQIPATDEPMLFRYSSQVLSSIVIRLAAGSEPARAAVVYCGPLVQMERGVDVDKDHVVPRFARKTEFSAPMSDRGDYLGRIVTSQYIDGVQHTFSHLRPDWYRTYADPFVRAGQQDTPFFYAFQPEDYPYEVAFAWFKDDPVPMTNPVTGRKRLVLNLTGIIE